MCMYSIKDWCTDATSLAGLHLLNREMSPSLICPVNLKTKEAACCNYCKIGDMDTDWAVCRKDRIILIMTECSVQMFAALSVSRILKFVGGKKKWTFQCHHLSVPFASSSLTFWFQGWDLSRRKLKYHLSFLFYHRSLLWTYHLI